MARLDLTPIRGRLQNYYECPVQVPGLAAALVADVPPLIAEVERLRLEAEVRHGR